MIIKVFPSYLSLDFITEKKWNWRKKASLLFRSSNMADEYGEYVVIIYVVIIYDMTGA